MPRRQRAYSRASAQNWLRPALLLTSSAAIASVLIAVSPSTANSATALAFETEAMSWSPTTAAVLVNDTNASGGKTLQITVNSTGTRSSTLPAGTGLSIRARSDKCMGTPTMTVTIDGANATAFTVSSAAWTVYKVTKTITAAPHTIKIATSNLSNLILCRRAIYLDTVSVEIVVPPTTTTTPPPTTTTPPPTTTTPPPTTTTPPPTTTVAAGTPIFTGDYETGDPSQWAVCQTKFINGPCSSNNNSNYSLQVQNSQRRQGSFAARFELRDGDVPSFGGGERTEVEGTDATGGREGEETWYQWSTMFTSTFPSNHATQGWGLVAQWHPYGSTGSPPVSMNVDVENGKWGLVLNRQSSPGTYIGAYVVWKGALLPGTWQDIKLHIKWSANDNVGYVEMWHNGTRQTFTGGPCSGQTRCTARTLIPGNGGTYFKQGYFRDARVSGTGIVYHDGFRVAKTEAALGSPTP
ncbi:heparin lyase I family protein [Antrihabitans sp. YC2-6]|uniref:heparin lyase I family protein n=1 Tax=Antrihabitans sp. YC2-6 TaxID=2799498 RepID=UPI0018F3C303|nr:heparin lyase I family protein [Antrihabitans sp. YC2-6]MBJ8344007.1 heparin lyase I family protein [Antrihabitans sp. YC2-6]